MEKFQSHLMKFNLTTINRSNPLQKDFDLNHFRANSVVKFTEALLEEDMSSMFKKNTYSKTKQIPSISNGYSSNYEKRADTTE